jgi:ParB-like nuclease domain
MNEHLEAQPLRYLSPVEALAWLDAEVGRAGEQREQDAKHAALPPSAIEVAENLFQPRAIAEWHLTGLVAAVKSKRTLPPLLVYRVGKRAFLLDGHHRLEAYRRVRIADPVPVEFFQGSPAEAVLAARKANSEPKLPMSVTERHDDAWRLMKLGRHSKAEIQGAANVSHGSVAAMRAALSALGQEEAEGCRTWREAREKATGKEGWTTLNDDERQARLDALAEDWTRRLGKTFGTKLSGNPEVAASALAGYFGRRLPEIMRHLKGHISRDEWDAEADDSDF